MYNEIIRDLPDDQKPLCPNLGWPSNPSHELQVRVLDAFYEATDKDEDGELNPEVEKAYAAAAYKGKKGTTDRMDLYVTSAAFYRYSKQIIVETYWFKCHVCGFVLPAYEKK